MKLSSNFVLQEFVPKGIYEKYGDKAIWFIDKRIVTIAQFFRERFRHPITINDWHKGGNRNQSGLRYWNSGIGASMSQHKYGRAIDMKWLSSNETMDEIRNDIKTNEQTYMDIGLTTIEEGTDTWIHADVRWTRMNKIKYIPLW